MASGAGQGPFARPESVKVDVVVDGNVQKIITFLCLEFTKFTKKLAVDSFFNFGS